MRLRINGCSSEPSLCAHEISIKSLVDLLADITMIKLSNSGDSDQSVHKLGSEIFFSFDTCVLKRSYSPFGRHIRAIL